MSTIFDNLTPAEAWKTFVGYQTTREFIGNAVDSQWPNLPSLIRAVVDYVKVSPLCKGLTEDQQIVVSRKLYEHLEA